MRRARAFHRSARWLVSSAALLAAAAFAACSVKLDPTLAPSTGDPDAAGGAPAVIEPKPVCVPVKGTSGNFVLCKTPLAQAPAAADCNAQGGELASVRTPSDNEAITVAGRQDAETTNVWLGATRDEAHFWTWPDGSVFWHGRYDGAAPDGVFHNFMEGEPNNTSSTDQGPEPCLVLVLSSGTWNDRACELELSYVCELSR